MSDVKLTGYIMRDYDETAPIAKLHSVAPYSEQHHEGLILHYGFKSVLSNLSELRMRADSYSQYFFEVNVTVDVGEFIFGRVSEEALEETRFLNLAYCNKALNNQIETVLGKKIEKNLTKNAVYSVEDVIELHNDPLFAHLDVIVFPAKGRQRGKPDPMSILFYGDNIKGVTVTNPNKGEPFEVEMPEFLEIA